MVPLANSSPVRIKTSWRWFSGTLLTGVAGLLMIGGALHASFDGEIEFQLSENIFVEDEQPISTAAFKSSAKTDRVLDNVSGAAVKQIIHESQVKVFNDKEFVEVKPYIRLTANLALSKTDLTNDLAPFNPLKLFSEAETRPKSGTQSSQSKRKNKAVKQVYADIELSNISFDQLNGYDESELQALTKVTFNHFPDPDASAYGDHIFFSGDPELDYEGNGAVELVENNESTLAPNSSVLAKGSQESSDAPSPPLASTSVKVTRGDTLMKILMKKGASLQEAKAMSDAMAPVFPANRLKIGQEIRLSYTNNDAEDGFNPVRLSMFEEDRHLGTVGRSSASASFTVLDSADSIAPVEQATTLAAIPSKSNYVGPRTHLYNSLFETGRKNGLDDDLLNKLMRIHSYDIDLKRKVQPGDKLEIFFAEEEEGVLPDILYSSLTIRGENRTFYRFRTPDDGVVDYYDSEGRSAKKFLIRKPMNGGRLRSRFGMRRHPILRVRKLHTGVDWSAPRGTPIVAAGNGVVEKAKWASGYGRYTLIRHANGYKTAYAHQTRFAKGIYPGAKVRQGQVIGYVGSTGLSTGPHLHYEVIVNGNFVDPLRIRVPRGRTLRGPMLEAFQREKQRIDRLMSKPPTSTKVAAVN